MSASGSFVVTKQPVAADRVDNFLVSLGSPKKSHAVTLSYRLARQLAII